MKKVGIVVVAFILAGVAWFLISRTNPVEKQGSGKAQAATTNKSQAAVESPKVQAGNKPNLSPVPALPASSNQTPSVVDSSVVEVITGDVGTPEKNIFSEPYIKRCRPIEINPQILDKDGKLEVGSKLGLALFPDAKYAVTVQMVNRSPQGDLQVGGKLDGEEYGTFILSSASGVVLARLADPKARRLFLIRCGGPDRAQYAVEVDIEKAPAQRHFGSEVPTEKH
jgi:hypothetical protein